LTEHIRTCIVIMRGKGARVAVYVLHAFEKKAQKTPKRDLELGRSRYRDLLEARRKGRYGKG